MQQSHSGRKVIAWMAAIVALVTLGFIAAVTLNLDLIHYAVRMNRALPPELQMASGDMVLAMEGRRPSFYIDKAEVSARAYAEFLRSRGETVEAKDGPATAVAAAQQAAFCAWAGKRLPSEKELRATFGAPGTGGFRCAKSIDASASGSSAQH